MRNFRSIIVIGLVIAILLFASSETQKIAIKQERVVADLLVDNDKLLSAIDEAKVRSLELSAQDAEIQEFLGRWMPYFDTIDPNSVIRKVEALAVQHKVISLSPRMGKPEEVYISGEPIVATPFSFTFISESFFPLHKLVFAIQRYYQGARLSQVSISSEGENLELRIDLSIPTKEGISS